MIAIGVTSFGGPEALRVLDLPVPEPGPGEVRIRVHAAAVNSADATFRGGGGQARLLGDRPPPWVPGMDAAGVVDKLGPGSGDRLAAGDRVVAFVRPAGPHGGAYAQFLVTGADSGVDAAAERGHRAPRARRPGPEAGPGRGGHRRRGSPGRLRHPAGQGGRPGR